MVGNDYEWENTNKLLGGDGWIGTKTGITPNAGPCLAATKEIKGVFYTVILIKSKSMESRWDEAR